MQCQASTMQQQSTIATGRQSARLVAGVRAHGVSRSRTVVQARTNASVQRALVSRALARPLRVAVIGGGPSGACAAETLAKGGVETYLLERKLDNCKVGV
jgi:geranylgeranyl reductase